MSNKRQGSTWELEFIKMLAEELGLEAFDGSNYDTAEMGSARMFSRHLDGEGIDIWFRDERPADIQNKSFTTRTKEIKLPVESLERLGETGVVAFKVYRKKKVRRTVVGRYILLRPAFFFKLLKAYYELLRSRRDKSKLS
jgi:hypothetical protein